MVLNLFNRDRIYKPSEFINQYTVEKVMGEGRYGICYQVSHGRKMYILKQLKRSMLKRVGAKAKYEEEILAALQHERIPQFIEKIQNKDLCGYVLEFKEGKTFDEIIYFDKYVFSRNEIFGVGSQLISILEYLHSNGIVHRDIRVPNTLYSGGKVILVDFGLARWIYYEKYRADMDFAFLGDFLLHLYYTSFESKTEKSSPWYEELKLTEKEMVLLKRLLGIEQRYENIYEIQIDFNNAFKDFK